MKNIIILLVMGLAASCYGQESITNGMSGKNVREAINSNFDTAYNYINGYYNVKDFGAIGDGVSLDNTAIKNAINTAKSTNRIIYFPQGTYRCDTSISISGLTKSDHIEIIGAGNVILDFSNITDYSHGALNFESDTIMGVPVTYDINDGDSLFYANLSGAVRGDIIQFYSTDDWGGIAKKGEYLKIRENIGDTCFSVYKGFVDDYTASTTRVQLCNMASASISNITIIYDNIWHESTVSPANIKFINLQNVVLSYVKSYDNKARNFDFQNCYNVTVKNCVTYETDRYGKGYGVHAAGVHFMNVTNCMFDGVRHGFTTDPGLYHSIPARFCNVNYSIASGTRENINMLDTHAESEYIIFESNLIYGGGIGIRDRNVIIRNNTLYTNDNGGGISIFMDATTPVGWYLIEGNKNVLLGDKIGVNFISVYGLGNSVIDKIVIRDNIASSIARPLHFQSTSAYLTINELHINDNIFKKTGSVDSYAVANIYSYNMRIGKLFVNNNRFINETTGTNSIGLFIITDSLTTGLITNNYIESANDDYVTQIYSTKDSPTIIYTNNYHNGIGAATFGQINKLIYQNNILDVTTTIPNTIDSLWIMGNVNLDGTAVSNSAGWVYNAGSPW